MEEKILTALKDLGYGGSLTQKGNLRNALEYGSKSIEYTKLVNYLTTEIRTLANIDEEVNAIASPEDSVSFIMEISSFLKELNCPYQVLTQGHVSDRLQNVEDRELLLDYLITELMTARMVYDKMPKTKIELKLQETPEASNLKDILVTLDFPKPPADITVQKLFNNLTPKVEGVIKKVGVAFIGKPFFSGFLSEKQWKMLNELQKDLNNDYKIRREMLLTRLDVTIQSFQWSDRTKGKEDMFQKVYKNERVNLNVDPNVDLSHLLAARADLAIIEKTSCANVRKNTKSSIQKVIIGQVPDRGGRTNEIAPPPPEMPSWQQRAPGPQRGGFNQGRGRGNFNQGNNGRGGYNQGGGQQSYSKGNSQYDSGRGNNNIGNSSNRGNSSYSGFKSSLGSNSKPFSNFDTSLSMYSSYSSSFSKFGSSSTNSDNFGHRANSGSDRDSFSKSPAQNFDSAGSYDNPNKRPRVTYGSSGKDFPSKDYSQKRSFNIAGDNEDRGNYSSRTNYGNYGGDRDTAFDSAGSYDTNKRVKSYDSFKTDNKSYSDQYVRDTQHNQQNHSRNESSRGRSNYHRGQGNRYNR